MALFQRAYSAPESEQYTIGPYLPAELELYDYDSYESGDTGELLAAAEVALGGGRHGTISLVVSVSLLVTRTDTDSLANPATTTTNRRRYRIRSPPRRRHRHRRRPPRRPRLRRRRR